METLNIQKADLRNRMKRQLKAMDSEERRLWDQAVCRRLLELPELRSVKKIYGYMSLSWETGTDGILDAFWKSGVHTALPRVKGERMDFFEVFSPEDLTEGAYHIREPKEGQNKVSWPEAVILVPGLAFSSDGRRLGKGGGYYDRFLAKERGHKTVALSYGFQITDEIPSGMYDVPVDMIVTPERIIRRQGGF